MPSITIGTQTPVKIVDVNPQRISLIISNWGSSYVFLGKDSTVTTATGIFVGSGETLTEDGGGGRGMYLGAYYGISEDSTNDVRYWERTR